MIDEGKYNVVLQELLSMDKSKARSGFKLYINSLADLTRIMLKDETTYRTVSPTTKKWIESFKAIFGNSQANHHCSSLTILCLNILKCFCKFESDYAYKFYCDWKDILSSSTSSKRAEIFIENIRKFEFLFKHIMEAQNRWSQLTILGILRTYTKKINYDEIKKLKLEGCDAYLEFLMILIDLHRHQHNSVKTNNALLSDINSKNDYMLSFQPYKIICDKIEYIVTDHELWMDFNVPNKVITFVAISVINRKNNVFGMASTNEIEIVSNPDHTVIVKCSWRLTTQTRSYDETEIVFYFSQRVHNSILHSKLKTVFNVVELDKPVLSKDVLKTKTVASATTSRIADETMLSSSNLRLVELEKRQIAAPSVKSHNAPQGTVQQLISNEENNRMDQNIPKELSKPIGMAKSKSEVINYLEHPSSTLNLVRNDENLSVKDSKVREVLASYKKPFTKRPVRNKRLCKRRRDQLKETDNSSTDTEHNEPYRFRTFNKKKRIRKRESEVPHSKADKEQLFNEPAPRKLAKREPLLMVEDKTIRPSIPNITGDSAITDDTLKTLMIAWAMKLDVEKAVISKDENYIGEKPFGAANVEIPTLRMTSPILNGNVQKNPVACLPHVSNQGFDKSTYIIAEQKIKEERNDKNNAPDNIQVPPNFTEYFDEEVYNTSWAIRNFIEALQSEEQDEVEDNEQLDDDEMEMKIDEFYESVSTKMY